MRDNWVHVGDALSREAGVSDPVALVMDFRFAGARRLARLLCWDTNVEELEAECRPDELVLVAVACRRDAADALALVSPQAVRRLRQRWIPPGHALVAILGDGWILNRVVARPAVRTPRR